MTRLLVTGGAGFIGSHLVGRLLGRGDAVTVLDDLSTGGLDNLRAVEHHPQLRFVEGSVLDEELVGRLVAEADQVYHLAAAVGVEWILSHPLRSLETNIRGSETVLRACAQQGQLVLLASTSEVYGKNDKDALGEDDDRILGSARLARWFYSAAKAIDEAFAMAYFQERGLPTIVVRFFNTVGPRQTGRYGMVVPRLVRQALRGEPLTVYGDGQQTRCFTNVRDAVQAVLLLTDCSAAAGEVFNIGQRYEITILDLARKIVAAAGSSSPIVCVPYHAPEAYGERADGYEDMRRRVPDTSKLQQYTGFVPEIPLDETLREVIAYERSAALVSQP